jgi:hypothetical protein
VSGGSYRPLHVVVTPPSQTSAARVTLVAIPHRAQHMQACHVPERVVACNFFAIGVVVACVGASPPFFFIAMRASYGCRYTGSQCGTYEMLPAASSLASGDPVASITLQLSGQQGYVGVAVMGHCRPPVLSRLTFCCVRCWARTLLGNPSTHPAVTDLGC